MNIISGIYIIINKKNNKVYIGQSINIYKRWTVHKCLLNENKHYNTHLQNAWNKYGKENFSFEILLACDEALLNEKEIYYISLYKSNNSDFGYNISNGGQDNKITEETRKKMSLSHIGKIGTTESRKKQSEKLSGINNPMYGKKLSEHPRYGKKQSESAKQKISESYTAERRNIYRERMNKEKNPMFGKTGAENPYSHKVMCVETGHIFNSLREAANWCGLKTTTNITNVCNGKRKHAGKNPEDNTFVSWKYIDTINQ